MINFGFLLARKSFYVDIILAICIIVITLINPFWAYGSAYLGGFINSGIILVIGWLSVLGLILLCLLLIILEFIRALYLTRLKQIHYFGARILLIIFSFWFSIIFYNTHLFTANCIPFTKGLAHWAEHHVDVAVLEEFLRNFAVDEEKIPEGGDSYALDISEWPGAVKKWRPNGVGITNVYDKNHRQMNFFWGGGFLGWGMVVGAIPPRDLISGYNRDKTKYTVSFHPHGYVFFR